MRNLGRYALKDMLTACFNVKQIRGVAATGKTKVSQEEVEHVDKEIGGPV